MVVNCARNLCSEYKTAIICKNLRQSIFYAYNYI